MEQVFSTFDIFHIILLHLPAHILYFISSSPYQEACYAHLYKNVKISQSTTLQMEQYESLYRDNPQEFIKIFHGVELFIRFYTTTPSYVPNELTFTDANALHILYQRAPNLCKRCKIHLDYFQNKPLPLWIYDLRIGSIKSKVLPCPAAEYLELAKIKGTISEIPLVTSLCINGSQFNDRILRSPRLTHLRVEAVKSVSLGRKNYLSSLVTERVKSIDVSQCRSLTRVSVLTKVNSYALPSSLERLTLYTSVLTDLKFLTKLRYLDLTVGGQRGTLVLPTHLEELRVLGLKDFYFYPKVPFTIPEVQNLSLVRVCLRGFKFPVSVVGLDLTGSLEYDTEFNKLPNLRGLRLSKDCPGVKFPPDLDYLDLVRPTALDHLRVKSLRVVESPGLYGSTSLYIHQPPRHSNLKYPSGIVHLKLHIPRMDRFDIRSDTMTSLELKVGNCNWIDLSMAPQLTELTVECKEYSDILQLPPKLQYLLLSRVNTESMNLPLDLRYILLDNVRYPPRRFGNKLEHIVFKNMHLYLAALPPTVLRAHFIQCSMHRLLADYSNTRMNLLYILDCKEYKINNIRLPNCLKEFTFGLLKDQQYRGTPLTDWFVPSELLCVFYAAHYSPVGHKDREMLTLLLKKLNRRLKDGGIVVAPLHGE